jgi:hypothetical protein
MMLCTLDDQEIRMRVLAAEDRVHLGDIALPRERLEIVRHGHQVGLRRQLVSRMAPVGLGKNTQLTRFDKGLQLRFHVPEETRGTLRIAADALRKFGRRRGIG